MHGLFLVLLLSLVYTDAFFYRIRPPASIVASCVQSSLQLAPLDEYELRSCLSNKDALSYADCYDFYLIESKDIDEASRLALDCFYQPRLKLNLGGDVSKDSLESIFWNSIIGFFNNIDKNDSLLKNWIGFTFRSAGRLKTPNFELSKESFIIGCTEKDNDKLIGCVEICLEEPTGLLTDPITISPFSSKYNLKGREQPYLCNLCVHPSQRRQGLGIVLCQLCEELVVYHWPAQYARKMYLHVEEKNEAALCLYTKMGYQVSDKTDRLGDKAKKLNGLEGILFYERELVGAEVRVMSDVE